MKKTFGLISSLILASTLTVQVFAQNSNSSAKTPPKDDAEIQTCINGKFAASPSLKTQNFSASVASGVATLTGNAKNAGSKGAATNIAKGCGAKSVVNNITVAVVDDGTLQKCINDKFASSPSLKSQGFSATVTGGVATLTGTAKDAGSKGAATNIAKACGAKSVTNNISVAPKPGAPH
jgi:osmotically-inducible protein OsmY